MTEETATARTLRLMREEWVRIERERIAKFLEYQTDPGYFLAPAIKDGLYPHDD